jgi:hypothetical protein
MLRGVDQRTEFVPVCPVFSCSAHSGLESWDNATCAQLSAHILRHNRLSVSVPSQDAADKETVGKSQETAHVCDANPQLRNSVYLIRDESREHESKSVTA